ncbi:hypothetical protein F5Y14DRAFT_85787 [Nemania sp. NC0429]|nr:hypothetical protein F5Y14DRAFT_85787 [Nemania sp. NC0429]
MMAVFKSIPHLGSFAHYPLSCNIYRAASDHFHRMKPRMVCSSPRIMPSELVYQHQQQIPINGTISGMAPPGNETGYYYIPVANLPWQTSWQELKDHVRTVCSVEHVEINEDSTSGHVVLKGRANFDAAFRLLNGGVFNDRALIADGRNVDNWVLVKHHVNGPTSSPPRYSTISAQQTSFVTTQSPPSYSEWLLTSTGPSYIISPVMESPPYFAPYTMSEYTESATVYTLNPTLPYQSGPYTQQHTQQEYYGNSYPVSPQNHMATAEGRQCYIDSVPTKKRKIIIRQIQPWATESQIRELIRHKAGSESESLLKLDMPLASGQQGGNRGYVIATFGSDGAAEKIVKRLNNYKHDGRVLEVKHTKESTSDHQPSLVSRSSQQHHSHRSHQSHRGRHDEKIRKGTAKDSSHSANTGEKSGLSTPSSASESSVVIAHGSSISHT